MTELKILDWLSNLDPAMKAADDAVRKYFSTIDPGYYWRREGDTVVLQVPFRDPIRYDEPNLRLTLSNVESRRSQYGTHDAWQKDLVMFQAGLAFFLTPS